MESISQLNISDNNSRQSSRIVVEGFDNSVSTPCPPSSPVRYDNRSLVESPWIIVLLLFGHAFLDRPSQHAQQLHRRHSVTAPNPKYPHRQLIPTRQLQDRRPPPTKQSSNYRPHRHRRLLPRIGQPRRSEIAPPIEQSVAAAGTHQRCARDRPRRIGILRAIRPVMGIRHQI